MLNQLLCISRPISQWLILKSIIAKFLITPSLVILFIASLILLPLIVPKLRWKRFWSGFAAIILVIYFSATLPFTVAIANQGLVAFIPPDTGKNVDAIVILGRGEKFRQSRVKVAARLWDIGRAPLIFASGVGDGKEIVQQLKQEGIPDKVLSEEHCSHTTKENALFTASILKQRGVKTILLVTDPPHMLRSLLTFKSVGFEVIPHSSPVPSALVQTQKAMLVFYEYMGLVSYSLHGHFLPSQQTQQENQKENQQVAIIKSGDI